jgi:tetrathionate reductase subunit B
MPSQSAWFAILKNNSVVADSERSLMKTKLAMVIDSSTCIDCKGCMAACNVENKVPDGHWRNWIQRQEMDLDNLKKTTGKTAGHYQPGNCRHCDNPT